MNYASKILAFLSDGDRPSQLLMVAGAPPVERQGDTLKIAFNALLTPDDIRDTLNTFSSHVRRESGQEIGGAGVFAFGMPGMGRFRVHYLTQRGSKIVSIQRMPFNIPGLEKLLSEPGQVKAARGLLNAGAGGVVVVTGVQALSLVPFCYALLAHVNETRQTVIAVCEESLSFSLKHGNSVIVQMEVGIDVDSLEAALTNSECLNAGVLYAREPHSHEEWLRLVETAQSGTLVLVSVVSHDNATLQDELKIRLKDNYPLLAGSLLKTVRLLPDEWGKVRLVVT